MSDLQRRTFFKGIFGNLFLVSLIANTFILKSPVSANNTQKKKIDLIVVWKSKRRLTLFSNKKPIKTYRIRLGFDPIGPKRKEGDGRTPEGNYWITHKNPDSKFNKSLGLNYPSAKDKMLAKKLGIISPGKDIFIHGGPKNFFTHLFFDWTEGCIAVTDSEINEIYSLVPVKTPIFITS